MPAKHRDDDQSTPDPSAGAAWRRRAHALLAARPWQQRRYQVGSAVAAATLLAVGAIVVLGPGNRPENAAERPVGSSPDASGPGASPAASSTVRAPSAAPNAKQTRPARSVSDQIHVTNSGTIKQDRRTLRVISAYGDLTGQRELAWAADTGHPVGAARCTQNFRFNPGSKVGERPTMLLCWRTSATKSVATIAVDLTHRPSEAESVATIDEVWRRMG